VIVALTIYMDVHIPAAITDGLRRNGLDVLTSQQDQTRTADDEDLLGRAAEWAQLRHGSRNEGHHEKGEGTRTFFHNGHCCVVTTWHLGLYGDGPL
jgi:hypothetical protein